MYVSYPTRLQPVRRLHKKIIRIITFSKIITDHTCPLFKELAVSPLDDVNNETIALFMFGFFDSILPSLFNDYLGLNKDVDKHNTRSLGKIQGKLNMEQFTKIYQRNDSLFKKLPIKHIFSFKRKRKISIINSEQF